MNLTVSQVTVTDGLLTSMKINCDIYCHRAPPLLITNPTVSVKQLTVGGACFITSDYADYTDSVRERGSTLNRTKGNLCNLRNLRITAYLFTALEDEVGPRILSTSARASSSSFLNTAYRSIASRPIF